MLHVMMTEAETRHSHHNRTVNKRATVDGSLPSSFINVGDVEEPIRSPLLRLLFTTSLFLSFFDCVPQYPSSVQEYPGGTIENGLVTDSESAHRLPHFLLLSALGSAPIIILAGESLASPRPLVFPWPYGLFATSNGGLNGVPA